MDWRAIQQALTDRGFRPGPIDGIPGRLTRGALVRYQQSIGVPATGQMDPATARALLTGSRSSRDLPWMDTAWAKDGVREWPGRHRANPEIMAMAKALDLDHYTDDDIAWCGLFVGYAIATGLPAEPLPANPLGARQWLKFGTAIEFAAAGAVAILWRGSRSGWQGHVAFVVGADKHRVALLGGNQGNRVRVSSFPRDRLLGFRWPRSTITPPVPVEGDASAPLTDGNEE